MSLLDQSVRSLLDDVAARTPAPGAGAAAAFSAAMAAALTTMVARFSDADDTAEAAETLRRRVQPLADADGEAYAGYLEAVRLPTSDPGRAARVTEALSAATDVPLEIVEVAAEVAGHATRLAQAGNPRLRGDAVAAALVASAAADSAAALVAINLAGADDPRLERARVLALATREQVSGFLDRPGRAT